MTRMTRSFFNMLVAAIVISAIGLWAPTAMAQDDAAVAAEPIKGDGVLTIVLQNIDFVFIIIIALSMVAVTLMISSALRLRKGAFMPEATINTVREMIETRQFKELIEFTEDDPSFVARAINPALKRAPSFSAMKEAMETAIGEQTADQFRKIEYLNIIGNLGPLLGLLGTVLGMIDAFSAMKAAGGAADPSILAGGISKALSHTFMGLFLAVPALAAFGVLRTITDKLTIRAALTCEELLLMIKPAEAKSAAVSSRPGGAPSAPSAPARPRVNPVPQPPTA